MHCVRCACPRTRLNTGSNIATNTAMIPITTNVQNTAPHPNPHPIDEQEKTATTQQTIKGGQ